MNEIENEPPAIGNKRHRTPPAWMDDYHLYLCEPSYLTVDINEDNHIDPMNYIDAMRSQESDL